MLVRLAQVYSLLRCSFKRLSCCASINNFKQHNTIAGSYGTDGSMHSGANVSSTARQGHSSDLIRS